MPCPDMLLTVSYFSNKLYLVFKCRSRSMEITFYGSRFMFVFHKSDSVWVTFLVHWKTYFSFQKPGRQTMWNNIGVTSMPPKNSNFKSLAISFQKKNIGNNLHGVTRGLNLFQHRSGPGSSIVQSLQTASAIISCFYSNQKNTLQFGPIFCVLFLCG
jgi:hypothetical protein